MTRDRDPFARLGAQLRNQADRLDGVTRQPRPSRWATRALAAGAAGLLCSAGAYAFVAHAPSTSGLFKAARPNSLAATRLTPLIRALDESAASLDQAHRTRAEQRPSIRGATLVRGGVTVAIGLSPRRVCAAVGRARACEPLPLRRPLLLVTAGPLHRLLAVVPDGVVRIETVTDEGRSVAAPVATNLAVVPLPNRLVRLSLIGSNGRRRSIAVPRRPGNAASIKTLKIRRR